MTGAFVLEVSGETGRDNEDALAARMSGLLEGQEGVRVTRSEKTADLQVRDLEDSISGQEVTEAIALAGGCRVAAVRVSEFRRAGRGLNTAARLRQRIRSPPRADCR